MAFDSYGASGKGQDFGAGIAAVVVIILLIAMGIVFKI